MSELEKALQYVLDNWDNTLEFIPSIEVLTELADLMEEYGENNDLPEGWWYEYGEEEDILEKLVEKLPKVFVVLKDKKTDHGDFCEELICVCSTVEKADKVAKENYPAHFAQYTVR